MPTDLETEIIKNLEAKSLSPNTISLYLKNLTRLNDNKPIKNFKFLADVEAIKERLSKNKPNTQKTYYGIIVGVLNTFKTKPIQKIAALYYPLMAEKVSEVKAVPTGEKSEQQEKNWLSWNDVLKVYERLKTSIQKFKDLKTISLAQYNTLLNCMVLALYCEIPPRRNIDYQKMNVVKHYEKGLKEVNYCCYDDNKFVFNVYKTSSTYGEQAIDIPQSLKDIITIYLKHHPLLKMKGLTAKTDVPFLVYHNGEGLSAVNSITRILNKIFKRNLGASMLRHIFITDKFGEVDKEKNAIAEEMGHSVSMQDAYIKNDGVVSFK
jgi:hypothetical protein